MAVEVLLGQIVRIVLLVLGGLFGVMYLIPRLKDILNVATKEKKAVDAFIYLLTIWFIVVVLIKVVEIVGLMQIAVVGEGVSALKPALSLLLSLVPFFQWIIVGAAIVIGLKEVVASYKAK